MLHCQRPDQRLDQTLDQKLDQRLDQRLQTLREEVRTMSQENEQDERIWRERLQRCQRQLKAKEEEIIRQARYFENFKSQLQHKLSVARDRERSLQNRIYALEKQLLDVSVSAATGTATIRTVRITARTMTHVQEEKRLPSMRGEGEGEEDKKEDVGTQQQPHGAALIEKDTEGGANHDVNHSSTEAKLQSFIINLQEDLKVLLEREEDGMTERNKLLEELLEAQGSSFFLSCKVEEMKAEVQQLQLSESSLMEEMDELRKENQRLQQIFGDPAKKTYRLSSTQPGSTHVNSVGLPTLPQSHATPARHAPTKAAEEVHRNTEERHVQAPVQTVPSLGHQVAAEYLVNDDFFSTTMKTSMEQNHLSLSHHNDSKTSSILQPLSFSTEFLNDSKLGKLEEIPSSESDALIEAFQSLGFGKDLHHLKVELQQAQAQLKTLVQENAVLKLQLQKYADEKQKIDLQSNISSFPAEDEMVPDLDQDNLIQALNRENRALAEKIQELLGYIELREEEIQKQAAQLREHIFKLEEDGLRLEQEKQEHASLISELTKKTEDDLNTIMELQQKLLESKEEQMHNEDQTGKETEKLQLNCIVETDSLTSFLSSGCKRNVKSLAEQETQLNMSIQTLKTEQNNLMLSIISLKVQQQDVAQSVQTQTEAKQQLTRTVWALKEQKDDIVQSLAGLRQDKEQLSRAVCCLRDEKNQHTRAVRELKGEKEELHSSISALQVEKEAVKECLSSNEEKRDGLTLALQGLQTERDDLSRTVLQLKQQRVELTESLKCLTEERDQKQQVSTLKADYDQLMLSVRRLKEEKQNLEHSIGCLRQEENQIKQIILSLREERNSLQTSNQRNSLQTSNQTAPKEKNLMQRLFDPGKTDVIARTVAKMGGVSARPCEACNSGEQSLDELMREVKALEVEVKNLQEEVGKNHEETRRMHIKLLEAEEKHEEAEMKAAKAAEQVIILTEAANRMEAAGRENESLKTQVMELQKKLSVLQKEQSGFLSLKAQTEEQFNILKAQLTAKTVALEELNSEYLSLKRDQGIKDDLSAALVSLRARYNDVRAKYDALLKRKSQADLIVAPLKAKLCCLVMKCQERNSLLARMMKLMRRQGCVEPGLTQRAEELLGDAALQEYVAAFAPGSNINIRDTCNSFTQEYVSQFQGCTSGFIPDGLSPAESSCESEQRIGVSESLKNKPTFVDKTSKNLQDGCEKAPQASPTSQRKEEKPVSPVYEQRSVKVAERGITTQLHPTSEAAQPSCRPERLDTRLDMNEKMCQSSQSLLPSPSSSSPRASHGGRLSSPEKIISLHEQLQNSLMGSSQAAEVKGRRLAPRRTLAHSVQTDSLKPVKPDVSFTAQQNHDLQRDFIPYEPQTAVNKPPTSTKPATLFSAVSSRSVHVKLSPNVFLKGPLKDISKTSAPFNCYNSPLAASSHCEERTEDLATLLKHETPNIQEISNVEQAARSASKTKSKDIDPQNTPLEFYSSNISTSNILNKTAKPNAAVPACTLSASVSPEVSKTSTTESTSVLGKAQRCKAAPAEVRSVEVIKTVGQSSLLIGWERPPLDELGCSNGTFVYGYRVLLDGEFHKSVMSSACTKCILENVDLCVPVRISVQTLGSNGLRSNSVHIIRKCSSGSLS